MRRMAPSFIPAMVLWLMLHQSQAEKRDERWSSFFARGNHGGAGREQAMTPHLVATRAFQPALDGGERIAGASNGADREAHELDHGASQVREVCFISELIDIDNHAT